MPIYMDRHFILGATRHSIENAHEKDLEIQGKYGVNFMTYWFDEERSTAFCLVSSPDEQTVTQVHQDAHGEVPNEIIVVDPVVVESFLGRIADPPAIETTDGLEDSAFRAIMFTDLSDFTSTTVRIGDAAAMSLWGRMAIVDTKPFKLRVILHRIFVERPQVTGIPAWPGGAACYRRSRYIL